MFRPLTHCSYFTNSYLYLTVMIIGWLKNLVLTIYHYIIIVKTNTSPRKSVTLLRGE